MQPLPRDGESALSVVGPRPMEWSTVPYGAPPLSGANGKQQRTSSLESPIMLLTGHQSAVYTMKFNPAGTIIASGVSRQGDIPLECARGMQELYGFERAQKRHLGSPVDDRRVPDNIRQSRQDP